MLLKASLPPRLRSASTMLMRIEPNMALIGRGVLLTATTLVKKDWKGRPKMSTLAEA